MRIVDVLPISAAGVTLIAPGAVPRYVAASGESALRFERLQTDLGEGPCIEAYETGEAVAVPDLREDARFPTFAARARLAGLVAVFTFPLREGDHRLGALDLYRTTAGPMNASEMAAAQTLADVDGRLPAERPGPRRPEGVVGPSQGELAARRAHRAAEPGAARPAARARDPAVPPVREDGGDPVRGPGQVQVGERHLRAPRRRRAARRRRSPAHRLAATRRHPRPDGRGRVRGPLRGPRPRGAGRAGRHADRSRAQRGRSPSPPSRCASRRASASPSPAAATRCPSWCSVTRTRPCTRSSAAAGLGTRSSTSGRRPATPIGSTSVAT